MSGPHTVGVLYWLNEDENDQISIRDQISDEEIAVLQFGDAEDRGASVEHQAVRIVAAWNALHGLSLDQVERLGRLLDKYNADEVEDMLRDEDL